MSDSIKVEVFKDGPIKLSNVKSMAFCGENQEIRGDCFLCRCGESKNAPYCDGTHKSVGFSGENVAQEEKGFRVWEGKNIKTYFNIDACMHVFHCKPLKELREKEALDETGTIAQEIMKVVQACPSGALSYELSKDFEEPTTPFDVEVDIIEGAEIRIQKEFEPQNFELQERQPRDKATLCRCGLSNNKPYCDAAHRKKKGFK